MSYVKANTDWLANCCYGIGVHWTAQTAPRRGKPLQFQNSVESFIRMELSHQIQLSS